jgi:anti-sigma B factor antagonist
MAEVRCFLVDEIDLANAADVEADLQRAVDTSDADLLVDCHQLTFIDTSGTYVLERTRKRLQEQGRDLRIVHTRRSVRRVFEILGLVEDLRVDA